MTGARKGVVDRAVSLFGRKADKGECRYLGHGPAGMLRSPVPSSLASGVLGHEAQPGYGLGSSAAGLQ